MDGPDEQNLSMRACDWGKAIAPDLNIIAVELIVDADRRIFSTAVGLPDDAFCHDGQLTKRELRLQAMGLLQPRLNKTLWDLGAGCGSIAIEWMRQGGKAVAVEKNDMRVKLIRLNANALGVPDLKILPMSIVDGLNDTNSLPPPDAIFLGGGGPDLELVRALIENLRSGGRFVSAAVTIESEAKLAVLHRELGGEMVRIAVSRLEAIGSAKKLHAWQPLKPVTLYVFNKPFD
jgi:precorrin-6Y C5,15-methyltransferase (decarboxylating)